MTGIALSLFRLVPLTLRTSLVVGLPMTTAE